MIKTFFLGDRMNKIQKREIRILESEFGWNVSTREKDGHLTVSVFFPQFKKTLTGIIDQNGRALIGLGIDCGVELKPFFLDREDMLKSIKPEYLDGFVDQLNKED